MDLTTQSLKVSPFNTNEKSDLTVPSMIFFIVVGTRSAKPWNLVGIFLFYINQVPILFPKIHAGSHRKISSPPSFWEAKKVSVFNTSPTPCHLHSGVVMDLISSSSSSVSKNSSSKKDPYSCTWTDTSFGIKWGDPSIKSANLWVKVILWTSWKLKRTQRWRQYLQTVGQHLATLHHTKCFFVSSLFKWAQ